MKNEKKLSNVCDLSMSKLDAFPKHPYKVSDDAEMLSLVESIKEYGLLVPLLVRQKTNGRYEILSGHRRFRALYLIGAEIVRCEIVELDKDAAIIAMVDSNLHRSSLLPSEKAYAYKMKLDAIRRQGKKVILSLHPRYIVRLVDQWTTSLLNSNHETS